MADLHLMEALQPGTQLRTESHLVTQEEILEFAGKYDPQPMHLDETAAKEGPFGQLVASGWHVLSVTMRLVVEANPFGQAHFVGAGVNNILFRKPLPPGTSIHVETTVKKMRPSTKGNRAHASLTALTKDSATGDIIVSQDWEILVYPEKTV
ncbi:MaoC/PaaZ C-terminal domain-containing protein [Aestuariispira insulae]|uniref:Acyl dehydratase n=1 Tax=Aestuariispira insulae TaxID=1461337 RepID=A0A3D9HF40_9PROT|nr:MaoC/PaaZ C-terminal domain-containing protein [Aestuariispira insulae]RED48094.1 acyl dehydratase [Aestuariispira insulae]